MQNDPKTERFLFLLRSDAQELFHKIQWRSKEVVEIFALRRTREHFPWLFRNRFDQCSLPDLMQVPESILAMAFHFYQQCDELHWYLESTQDMPQTVETRIESEIHRLQVALEGMTEAMDFFLHGPPPPEAALGLEAPDFSMEESIEIPPPPPLED